MTAKQEGRLIVHLLDQQGKPIQSRTLLLLAENKPALGDQYRLEEEARGTISAEFPPGAYSLQVFPVGFEVGHAFVRIDAGQDTELRLTFPPAPKEVPPATVEERLAVYGLSPDKVKLSPLSVAERQTVVLDFRRGEDKSAFTVLHPRSINDLKKWVGAPDAAFGHDQPRFGPLPDISERRLRGSVNLTAAEQEAIQTVAREYIYGNSKSVGHLSDLLESYVVRQVDAIKVAIFLYSVVTINAGGVLEIGNGSSVFFADVLRIHKTGTLRVVGDIRADIGRYEAFG